MALLMMFRRFMARARARDRFHHCTEVLTDLDRAQELGGDSHRGGCRPAGILQVVRVLRAGREPISTRAWSFGYAGDIVAAERLFNENVHQYLRAHRDLRL